MLAIKTGKLCQCGPVTVEEKIKTSEDISYSIPGKIEAENYFSENGIKMEQTSDTLGGYDVCWIEPNDFLEYNINVTKAGNYSFSFRAATERKDGVVEIYNSKGIKLGSVAITNTRSWQNWKTFSTNNIALEAGKQNLKLVIAGDRISLNWFEVK